MNELEVVAPLVLMQPQRAIRAELKQKAAAASERILRLLISTQLCVHEGTEDLVSVRSNNCQSALALPGHFIVERLLTSTISTSAVQPTRNAQVQLVLMLCLALVERSHLKFDCALQRRFQLLELLIGHAAHPKVEIVEMGAQFFLCLCQVIHLLFRLCTCLSLFLQLLMQICQL